MSTRDEAAPTPAGTRPYTDEDVEQAIGDYEQACDLVASRRGIGAVLAALATAGRLLPDGPCAVVMSEPPKRIQRRRNAGWRMPAGAVYVGRPTRWGNPFPADYFGQAQAMRLYREWLAGADHLGYPDAEARRRRVLDTLPELTGRDLACWCPLDQPCHADVLLDLARTKPEPYVHYVGHTVSDEPSQIKVIRASALIQTPAEMLADAEEMASAVKSWLSVSPEERNKTTRQAAIHRA